MNTNTMCKIKNRSSGRIAYVVLYNGNKIHQGLNPGEVKMVPYEEIRQLYYQSGGPELIYNYLQVSDEVLRSLNLGVEPEYYMSEAEIKELLTKGSLDAFLDCLDFAPQGVINLIKKYSVELPLEDYNKRKAIQKKLDFDIDKAIANNEASKEQSAESATPTRRVNAASEPATASQPARRTTPKYTVAKTQA